ncbi:ATP-binding protein [Mycoplasma feriruminatoris]|uniref:ATP-binding protein n=1 Tax=Mycoplasma feriruminatoris TaxID=1179777 RepID=UPI0002A4EA2F|nr:ATP-binding protein [Mycoplasma feriruminatoris]UKS54554.1 AAA domain family protein [Mycoplasma feriruminatoris]VZK65734.1 ATP-dependent zinc metalloprotease FtsH 4 [Mycoplasma feriruminatoris]VZR75875.1 ATP-dependent zinc metalloprotease FtsH 4 [Mycoplasma feriruminatoris]VZR98688.1 ATP-dependent zinc metalloprotease FtsH 4 [Mycoplasma feriruminatoris]
MKKANVINLIKYHMENNDIAFRDEAYLIASDFYKQGEPKLSQYIASILSDTNTFVPQFNESDSEWIKRVDIENKSLPLPDEINNDIIGIINASKNKLCVNKFLFVGPPGTGKTKTTEQIARILNRELFVVEFSMLIDSKLGQTQKNITKLFEEINNLSHPEEVIILFDEIDALALDRTNNTDIREMGRVTSTVLKCLDNLNKKVILIATTNLYKYLDKALIRRFDSVVDFDRYTNEDLLDIAEIIFNNYVKKLNHIGKNTRMFRKIISLYEKIPYPGTLENVIKTSLAFSDPNSEFDYLKRLYRNVTNKKESDLKDLKLEGFTTREIEILTGISKSQVARELKEL